MLIKIIAERVLERCFVTSRYSKSLIIISRKNVDVSKSIFFTLRKKKRKKKYYVHEGATCHYQRDNTTYLYWIDIIICITSVTRRGNWLIDETACYPKGYF